MEKVSLRIMKKPSLGTKRLQYRDYRKLNVKLGIAIIMDIVLNKITKRHMIGIQSLQSMDI